MSDPSHSTKAEASHQPSRAAAERMCWDPQHSRHLSCVKNADLSLVANHHNQKDLDCELKLITFDHNQYKDKSTESRKKKKKKLVVQSDADISRCLSKETDRTGRPNLLSFQFSWAAPVDLVDLVDLVDRADLVASVVVSVVVDAGSAASDVAACPFCLFLWHHLSLYLRRQQGSFINSTV